MRNILSLALLAATATQLGCTTIPNRFNTSDAIVEGCGYVVDGESTEGFSLEVAYKEYKFFPSSDPVILAARACFSKTAAELAKRKGKAIVPLTTADMSASTNRNIVDAQYLVNVTGRVRYNTP
jgi:hypothetical protein